jgi:uncharacterized protein (TIGR03437 family)
MLNRFYLSITLILLNLTAWAQDAPISSIRIYTEPNGGRFYVDGLPYGAPQVFLWPRGSKHIVQFPTATSDGLSTGCQVSRDLTTQFCFSGWTDSTGKLQGSAETITVSADPNVTWLKASLSPKYRLALRFIDLPSGMAALDCGGAPGDAPNALRTGLVVVGGACYGASADVWVGGPVTVNAYPFPGFVFRSWNYNGATITSFLATINVDRPATLLAEFLPAKRVQFVTSPPGLKLLIDRTTTPTNSTDQNDYLSGDYAPCKLSLNLPPKPQVSIPALCFAEFDFLPGSKHIFAAPTPQLDSSGKLYVFDKFSNGLEQNGVYTADSNVPVRDVITAQFVPGVQAAFLTVPSGLKLNIDGRDNWPAYSFVWGAGSKHTISAPATQVDASGRKWTFQGWSNGGAASQDIIANTPDPGLRLTANYTGLGQLKVTTNPAGIRLTIDAAECVTPCTIDRGAGMEVAIVAPQSVQIDDSNRLDFLGWSDNGAPAHSVKIGADVKTVFANYNRAFRLIAASDPADGVDFSTDPFSPDSFYAADTIVAVTATPRPGFKFRRWGGDLGGVYNIGRITMDSPHIVLASLDRAPYIAPAGIKNAAGDTPDRTVAPGSIISIYGESLAPRLETGPRNPLAQTLADVVVTVDDRILPLLFVSPRQINAQVLSNLEDGDYTLRVRWTGHPDVTGPFTVSRDAPGLFSQTNDANVRYSMALHEDGSPVTPDAPAKRGEMITVYGTGFGPYNQKIIDGFVFPEASNFLVADPVEVTAGGITLLPDWSGGAPGFAGMTATRFRVPDYASSTAVDLTVKVNGKLSNSVVLPVQ